MKGAERKREGETRGDRKRGIERKTEGWGERAKKQPI